MADYNREESRAPSNLLACVKKTCFALLLATTVFFLVHLTRINRHRYNTIQLPRPMRPQGTPWNDSTTFSNFTLASKTAYQLSQKAAKNLTGDLKKFFSPGLSEEQREIYLDLVSRFAESCDRNHVLYMLYWGSALGSYRHHGFIPWDDEIDIWIARSDANKLHKVVKDMGSNYVVYTNQRIRYKVTNKKRSWPAGKKAWRWPFLDICFYRGNSTHIWDTTMRSWTHPRSEVFPTRWRPFEGLWLKTPLHIESFLKKHWNPVQCCSREFNHAKEYYIRTTCCPCSKLTPYYAFVERRKTNIQGPNSARYVETLKFGSRLLWSTLLEN